MPGKVTSIFSLASFSSITAFSKAAFFISSVSSIFALASFTSCPTFGLSSGATSFIDLRTEVSSPFFPKKATLISFNLSSCSDASICPMASSMIFFNLSFISNTSFPIKFTFLLCNRVSYKEKTLCFATESFYISIYRIVLCPCCSLCNQGRHIPRYHPAFYDFYHKHLIAYNEC